MSSARSHPLGWTLGTVGFGYADWADAFYPQGTKSADYLSVYASCFDTVELDTTFHAIPKPESVTKWARVTPSSFRFAVKAPRAVTHESGLSRAGVPMFEFLRALEPLQEKLSAILLQFPPTLTVAASRVLFKFLQELPAAFRYAVEFRHASWNTPGVDAMLTDLRLCRVAADYLDVADEIRPTTDFLYIRWIGEHGRYGVLDREQIDVTDRLQDWMRRIKVAAGADRPIHGFFNNDYTGYAIGTCDRFKGMVGLPVRKPRPAQGSLFE